MGVYKMLVLNCQKMLEIDCHFLLESTCRLQSIFDNRTDPQPQKRHTHLDAPFLLLKKFIYINFYWFIKYSNLFCYPSYYLL